jgi:hypothetical protein
MILNMKLVADIRVHNGTSISPKLNLLRYVYVEHNLSQLIGAIIDTNPYLIIV